MNAKGRDPGLPPPREHIPALDGLRGLAILLVAFYHLTLLEIDRAAFALERWFLRLMGVGWCGVDLFFVLSGFLITGILLDSRERPHYFRNFYVRRALRIFPLYYAVLFLSLVVIPNLRASIAPAVAKALRFGSIGGDEIWYWAYLSNYAIARAGRWRHGTLDISWSLSIEEQFYLAWPALVLLLRRAALVRVCAVLVGLGFALRVGMLLAGATPIATYVVTPARVDTLAAGAWVAAVVRGPVELVGLVPAARRLFWGSLGLLVAAFLLGRGLDALDPLALTVGFSLLCLLFAALLVLVLASPRRSLLQRFFTLPAMRTFGKYSYAIYLLHLPLRALIRDTVYGPDRFPTLFGSPLPGQLLFYAVVLSVTLLAALASWHLFEKRFLALKRYAR